MALMRTAHGALYGSRGFRWDDRKQQRVRAAGPGFLS
jgi:hypothetical protein